MVARDAETNLAIDLETARRCEEAEVWRLQRIRRRQCYATVVDAGREGRWCWWATKSKVPCEEIRVIERGSMVVWGWVG